MVWRGASGTGDGSWNRLPDLLAWTCTKTRSLSRSRRPGMIGKATAYGTFPNTAASLEKLVKRLRQVGDGPLRFCFEAGPCGYGIHRTLTKMGEDCMVVAPSMIPRKSGERQKTDKRDASSRLCCTVADC